MASNGGRQQRPTLDHRMATWGHVRPEKRTVEDQRRWAAPAANTAAKPLDNARSG
jgi:hypothetical protein